MKRFSAQTVKAFNFLALNKNITWEIIKENIDKPWDLYWLGRNPNITFDLFVNEILPFYKEHNIKNEHSDTYYTDELGENPNITWEIVINNPSFPWNYSCLSKNPNITLDIVKNNKTKQWNWFKLSSYLKITFQDVLNNLDLPWCFNGLSLNKGITEKDIKEYGKYFPWNFYNLSSNPSISFDFMRSNPNFRWSYMSYVNSPNPNLTTKDLETCMNDKLIEYTDINFRTMILSEKIPIEIIKRFTFVVDFELLCRRSDVYLKTILETPEIDWDFQWIGLNPNITWNDIKELNLME